MIKNFFKKINGIFNKLIKFFHIVSIILILILLYQTCLVKTGTSFTRLINVIVVYLLYTISAYKLIFNKKKVNFIVLVSHIILMVFVFVTSIYTNYYGRDGILIYDKLWILTLNLFSQFSAINLITLPIYFLRKNKFKK